MSEKINLLDEIMAVETGLTPIEVQVGEHTLFVRRSHTGADVVAWQMIERTRERKRAEVLDSEATDDAKVKSLVKIGTEYIRKVLETLTVKPTTKESISGVVKLLDNLPADPASRIITKIGQLAGLVDEKGEAIPFKDSSAEETPTES